MLGLKDTQATEKYGYTRSLLNAYSHGKWLEEHTVKSQGITRVMLESVVRPPPKLQQKPKRGRNDIAALGMKNDIGDYEILVPSSSSWNHFMKYQRQLFSFPKLLEGNASNLVALALSAIALDKNPALEIKVDQDVKRILEGLEDLTNRYFFLPGIREKKRQIEQMSLREATVHLTAFGLFMYADWSWKRH